jgi:hypothetical protein
VIQAEQWFANKKIEGVFSMQEPPYFWKGGGVTHHSPKYYIDTLEGRMNVIEGDWIITGIAGEKYPCKDEIFKATYELVE